MKDLFPSPCQLPTQVFMGWTGVTHNLCFDERLRFWSLMTALKPLSVVSALVQGAPSLS